MPSQEEHEGFARELRYLASIDAAECQKIGRCQHSGITIRLFSMVCGGWAIANVNGQMLSLIVILSVLASPQSDGLASWQKVYSVMVSPRCLNCHTATNYPQQGDDRHRHVANVIRGPQDKDVVALNCATCHQSKNADSTGVPGAHNWHLAPLSNALGARSPRSDSNSSRHSGRAALRCAGLGLNMIAYEMHSELRRVVDTIPELIWTAAADGSAEFVNRCWSEYTGLTLEEARGFGWHSVIWPEDLPPFAKYWDSVAASDAGAREIEARVRRADGVYRWFLFRCSPLDEAPVEWYVTTTDIDDRKRAGEALRASEESFRLLVDSIPGLVFTTTPEGESNL
jgi:PAS domain S-box-containing protein